MKLKMDFPLMAVMAVLSEMANRSDACGDSARSDVVIEATPITHHHFGGVHYYSKFHRRYAWVRPVINELGELDQSRLLVAMGHADAPDDWKEFQNRMMHTFVDGEEGAANVIVSFILDGSLPETQFPGDYPFHEPELKHD